uniref:[histone H3]-trimethyl-L-lysine(27) demethylase n=1 Tax=Brachionus koreanus TaxID=1199090 RepID=A0A4Y6EQY7_9BILA|nr:lysine-specific demethylase 6A [Brachionus koreanus]
MIPNQQQQQQQQQQMNANYSNQYFDTQPPSVPATSPYQGQNFSYQSKPTQYPVQPRFMPSPGPQTPINTPMPQMMPNYQRPTPTSTPASIPAQSPTSPSVATFYPQYPQYPNQYQPVQYNQIMPNQMINQMPYQEQARFGHQIIQQPPIQPHMYPAQYQPKTPLNHRINLAPPPQPSLSVQKTDSVLTDNLNVPSTNNCKPNANKCQPQPMPNPPLVNKVKCEPDEKEESLSKAIYFLINLPLTNEEEEILFDYDSRFSEKSFLCALYKDSYFQRVNEIHLRLGLIYRELNNFQQSLKHFNLALIDTLSSLASLSKNEIKFCIAHLYESNHKYIEAVEQYEDLFKSPDSTTSPNTTNQASQTDLDLSLKSKIYRQLGWLYFYSDQLAKEPSPNGPLIEYLSPFRTEFKSITASKQLGLLKLAANSKLELNRKSLQLSLEYLIKSAQLDPHQNLTWYYLGRAFTCKLSSREAFISFRNSVNNPKSNSNTWSSIGVLYYMQKQYMDSLHAFVCALKAEPKHFASWLNLGVLYEKNNQIDECLKCYKYAIRLKLAEIGLCDDQLVANLDLLSQKLDELYLAEHQHEKLYKEEFIQLVRRVRLLDQYADLLGDKILKDKYSKIQSSPNQAVLPKLADAFNLDIPHDLKQKIFEQKKAEPCIDAFRLGPFNLNSDSAFLDNSNVDQVKNLSQQQLNLLNSLESSKNSLNNEQTILLNNLKNDYLSEPKNIETKNLQNLTFNNEHVKLDTYLTNGSNLTLNKTNRNCSNSDIEAGDDEILNQRIHIGMSSTELLDTCKSFGLNGIQNQCYLKPGRLRDSICKATQNQSDLVFESSEDEESDEDESIPYSGVVEAARATAAVVDKLSPPGPSVVLESKKDCFSANLQYFCLSNAISVVRGLGSVLKLDLSLFSTKSLVETDPEHVLEVRNQRQQPSDENWEPSGRAKSWKCDSYPSYTTLLKYAKYQANSFQEAVREEKLKISAKKFRSIKFGTNLDLSDEKKWSRQIAEMSKLPPFMRFVSAGNMLTHVGYKVFGVNTMQMYLKVPGCRTPAHQENNNFCSLNLNIGPGDCEWFGVHEKYWKLVESLCEKNKVDYLNESWWPDLDELRESGVPVYRFLQRPGDLVWVNAGCVHWVQAVGWCNNVSWNVGPMVYMQYKSAMERYEWNRLKLYKSIVPMVHLSWNLARNIKITDRRLFEYVKYVLMQSLKQCQLAVNYVQNCGCELKYQARQPDEPAHYCYDCECEVFNILFVSEQPIEPAKKSHEQRVQHVVHCQACARKRNHLLDNFVILNQFSMDELRLVYDQFQLYVPGVQAVLGTLNQTT